MYLFFLYENASETGSPGHSITVSVINYRDFRSSSDPRAQIDLIIDRSDQVINICEMKYSDDEFTIIKDYEKNLLHKMEAFRTEISTKKALHLTMITGNGLKHNAYAGIIQNEITAEELMRY